ncbi:3602_t:CDS:1, partial [Racocetra fulgida]
VDDDYDISKISDELFISAKLKSAFSPLEIRKIKDDQKYS